MGVPEYEIWSLDDNDFDENLTVEIKGRSFFFFPGITSPTLANLKITVEKVLSTLS